MYNNGTYETYKIINIDKNFPDILDCVQVGKFPIQFQELTGLSWESIGVYRMGPLGSELYQLNRSQISGKFLNVNGILVTCPNEILREK